MFYRRIAALALTGLLATAVFAEEAEKKKSDETDPPKASETITVTGKRNPPKEEVSADVRTYPASATVLTGVEIAAAPGRDAGEVLRSLPGMDYVYYGQGGIPSGPSVRGYTDRNFGQDIAGFLDGIPLNIPGFVASHGAMDLTPIFPEAVDRIELVRGPFDARYGDFHRGASLNFVTRDGVTEPSVSVAAGSFGATRVVGTYGNFKPDKISLYSNVDLYKIDGYARNQKVEHLRSFNKLLVPMGTNDLAVTLHFFNSAWDAPSYLDINKLKNGTISDKDAVNITDGGDLNQTLLAARYRIGAQTSDPLLITAYGSMRDWTRFRHDQLIAPTQTQLRQIDVRTSYGYRVEKTLSRDLFGRNSHLLVGTTLHRDDASTKQDRTLLGAVTAAQDNIDELLTNASLFVQEHLSITSWMKLSAALRYSWFDYGIDDRMRARGTYVDSYSDSKIDPKLGIVVTPNSKIELYAQYATGMRTPTPRTEVRQSTGSIDRVRIAETRNYELGLGFRPTRRMELRADIWRADNSNEIRSIPPGGTQFESLGKSRREGFDVDASLLLGEATVIFGGWSDVDAKLLTPPATAPAATHLPDVAENVGQLGFLSAANLFRGRVTFGADIAFYGAKDLNTLGTLRSETYERITANGAYQPAGAPYRVWLKGTAFPGSRYGESAFLFGSTIGVRPNPPLSYEVGVSYAF